MVNDSDPLPYDAEKFAEKYPHDDSLQIALKAAQEVAARTAPPQPEEGAYEALCRIDQGFDELRTKTEEALQQLHRGEQSMRKEQFIRQQEAEIKARHQLGIDATRIYDLKIGGQHARDEELRLFNKRIADNQELKDEINLLVNKQAERQDVVLQIIGQVQDAYLKAHGLDPFMPEPSKPEESNGKILATAESDPKEVRRHERNEMLIPRDFKDENTPEAASLMRLKGESDEQYQARVEIVKEHAEQAETEPRLELQRKPKGPSFG